MNWPNSITKLRGELEQARQEILAGKEPLGGLLLWYADWNQELKLVEKERAMQNQRDVAANYIRDNFEPADRIAVVLIDRKSGSVSQRLTTADRAASPEYQSFLRAKNASGADVYISMNTIKPDAVGRTKEDIAEIRHIFLDVDQGGKPALDRVLAGAGIPRPNYVLSTSPEKYQVIWKVNGFDRAQAEDLMRGMARQFGSDPAVTDISRVLRLPDFRNHKYEQSWWVKVESVSREVQRPDHFPRYEPDLVPRPASVPITHPGSNHSQSERDWSYALRALGRGEDRESVMARIAGFRPDKPNPEYYARHTVDKAAAIVQQRSGPER